MVQFPAILADCGPLPFKPVILFSLAILLANSLAHFIRFHCFWAL